jgi:hypothetical protein
VLEVQQAQQGGDGDRRAAEGSGEVAAPGGGEALVVQVGVDAGELGGEAFGLRREQVVPGVQRRGGRAKQRDSNNSDNGVIRPEPATIRSVFPQLSTYLDPDFFMGK